MLEPEGEMGPCCDGGIVEADGIVDDDEEDDWSKICACTAGPARMPAAANPHRKH